MLNSSGTIVARYSYDPYGRTTLVSGSNFATKQYTGDYYHATSGLNLTKYRAYDSNTGRWLARDPLGEQGGPNLYEYCSNNCINNVDPLGLTDYSEAQTQQTLNGAAAAATAGPVQGLENMASDNSGNGIYDFGANDPNNADTYNVNGTTMTSDQFGNYIAGYEAQAYDETYGTGNFALDVDYGAGYYYHNVPGGSKDPNDPYDNTGFPYITAGAAGYDKNFAPLNKAMRDPAAHPPNAQQSGGRRRGRC